MKRYLRYVMLLGMFFPLLLSGCSLGARSTRYLSIWMSNPANNTVIGLGDNLLLGADAVNTLSRPVTHMVFYANALVAGETSFLESYTAPDGTGYYGEIDWTPSETGEYFVQAQANPGVAISEAMRVCVIDFAIPMPSSASHSYAYGYEGPCAIPDRDEFATPGAISMGALASPDRLVYRPSSDVGLACPWAESISFQVTVNDPPEDVAFVAVDISVTGSPAGRHPGLTTSDTVVLTPRSTTNPSIKIYEGAASGGLNDIYADYFGDGPGDVTWTAKAIGRDGSILLTDGPHTIPAEPCAPVPFSAPLPGTETPTLTPAPASARDCPPGTFFSETTHRCIPIQILTPKSGGGACTLTVAICTAQGLSFDKNKCECVPIQ